MAAPCQALAQPAVDAEMVATAIQAGQQVSQERSQMQGAAGEDDGKPPIVQEQWLNNYAEPGQEWTVGIAPMKQIMGDLWGTRKDHQYGTTWKGTTHSMYAMDA